MHVVTLLRLAPTIHCILTNYAMYALLGQITLGKGWRAILTYHEVLLKKMTQIYMSCVFSALRYACSYMYCDAVLHVLRCCV